MSEVMTVLLAEDRPDEQYVTTMLLEGCGCRVIEAADGAEAVALAVRERPDLILLDLKMPVLDGYEAARRIRRDPALRSVPVVAYTAYHSYSPAQDAHEALAAGFDEHVIKPLAPDEMRELVRRHLPAGKKKGAAG